MSERAEKVPWRVGRKVGRTIYMIVDDTAENDVLIGMMDTPELAAEAVTAHNARLGRPRRRALSAWLSWRKRTRPVRVSVWDLANEMRWAGLRRILLEERGLTEEEANDVRVP